MIARPIWCRRFVGRREELGALSDARRALAQSRGSVVLIGGEAGIGKSRLVSQFLREVQGGRASRLATAECVAGGDEPLWPVRSFLRKLAGTEIHGAPPLVLRALAQVVPEALPPEWTSTFGAAKLGKSDLFAGLAAALRYLSAKRGTIAVVEDIHWADRSTLEFLAYLAARVSGMRLLLVATYRPDELETNVALADVTSRMLRERGLRHVLLEPFRRAEVMQLLDGALDDEIAVEQRRLQEIAERCDGNPFFAEELLKDVVERARDSDAADLPSSIRASIRHRLTRLLAGDRRLIELAAVLGQRFDPVILARVAEQDPDAVLAGLRRARDANIILEEVDGTRCRFRHALTRQAIYDGLLAIETRALHGRIVRVYESLPDASRPLYELAYHAWEARDVVAAFDYNERAGAAAFALSALPEAMRCFERSLELAAGDDARAHVLESIGNVAEAQADFPRAVVSLDAAVEIRLLRGEYDAAARLFVAAQGVRSNGGESVDAALLAFIAEYGARLGTGARDVLHVFTARLVSAQYAFDIVRSLLATVSPPEELPPRVRVNYFVCFLNMHAYRRDVAAWERVADDTSAIVPSLPPLLQAGVLATIAQTGVWIGGGGVISRSLDDADAVAARFGLDGIAPFINAVRAHHAFVTGDLAMARAALEGALRTPEVPVAQLVAAMIGPFVARALGEPELAARCFTSRIVQDALDDVKAPIDQVMLVAARAEADLAQRTSPRSAEALIGGVRGLSKDAPLVPTLLMAAAERVDWRDLAELVAFADPERLLPDDCAGRATSALVEAIAARRLGDHATAAAAGRAAAELYRTIRWPLFEARAWEAQGNVEAALDLYRRCGAVADLRRLSPGAAAPAAPPEKDPPLSGREREIARLVAAGRTNDAIAGELFVSRKTVEKHVSSILAKLELRSRAGIAAFVAAGGIAPRELER